MQFRKNTRAFLQNHPHIPLPPLPLSRDAVVAAAAGAARRLSAPPRSDRSRAPASPPPPLPPRRRSAAGTPRTRGNRRRRVRCPPFCLLLGFLRRRPSWSCDAAESATSPQVLDAAEDALLISCIRRPILPSSTSGLLCPVSHPLSLTLSLSAAADDDAEVVHARPEEICEDRNFTSRPPV